MSSKSSAPSNPAPEPAYEPEPTVVSGHQYHTYANDGKYGAERYSYIGKDDDGTPEFLDYGPKGGR